MNNRYFCFDKEYGHSCTIGIYIINPNKNNIAAPFTKLTLLRIVFFELFPISFITKSDQIDLYTSNIVFKDRF